jgi:hypothetical protein
MRLVEQRRDSFLNNMLEESVSNKKKLNKDSNNDNEIVTVRITCSTDMDEDDYGNVM